MLLPGPWRPDVRVYGQFHLYIERGGQGIELRRPELKLGHVDHAPPPRTPQLRVRVARDVVARDRTWLGS